MSLLSSVKSFFQVLARDLRVARRGAWPGWYILTHYRGRLHARRNSPPRMVSTRQTVGKASVKVFLTPAHLGTFYGVFAEAEYDLTDKVTGPPRTILDLGANAGMAAAYLHARYPGAEFACVEPDPRNIPLLERTLAANAIRARVFAAAVAAEAGELKLRFGSNPTCSALETSPMHDLAETVAVRVTTVPAILNEMDWDRIDLLKVDIEGSEVDLLGRKNGWLDRVGTIVLEIHPNTTPDEIGGFLAPFGFHLRRSSFGTEPVYLASRV